MKTILTNTFKRSAKKLHSNQITDLKKAIDHIQENPIDGELKTGDLSGIRVYKFHILHQLILLAYTYNQQENEITLLSFSPHENFYKNLKNQLN
ncbi:MAG: type II toxin-antitoxin system RelE/ParE family toxin [Gammaproteobacteria bacterium]|nr:type II toxin-antitoxin system RelE/ParE family toxin [Gammaproteobacteria bacterium]MBV9471121.1 type II toxin-antitoxin system RelE/ParE family toxin [Abditibacteriaceae bacterium]